MDELDASDPIKVTDNAAVCIRLFEGDYGPVLSIQRLRPSEFGDGGWNPDGDQQVWIGGGPEDLADAIPDIEAALDGLNYTPMGPTDPDA